MNGGKVVCGICPKHGFWKGPHCEECIDDAPKDTLHIKTDDWVTKGVWEHIDPLQPNMRFNSKQELFDACEKRGHIPKAFLKPKSQGKGWEIKRR